jgi:hypothetical protein
MHSIIKILFIPNENNNSTSPASRRSLPSGLGRHAGACSSGWGVGNRLFGPLRFGGSLLGCCTVPVIEHLKGDDGIECESGDEAVQDELIVHFLEGSKDARQGAEEVVENLENEISFKIIQDSIEKN